MQVRLQSLQVTQVPTSKSSGQDHGHRSKMRHVSRSRMICFRLKGSLVSLIFFAIYWSILSYLYWRAAFEIYTKFSYC